MEHHSESLPGRAGDTSFCGAAPGLARALSWAHSSSQAPLYKIKIILIKNIYKIKAKRLENQRKERWTGRRRINRIRK